MGHSACRHFCLRLLVLVALFSGVMDLCAGKSKRTDSHGRKAPVHRRAATPHKPASRSRRLPSRRAPNFSPAVRAAAIERISGTLAAVEQHFDNPAALAPFFERLYLLSLQPAAVHVLHYGDSHTASDDWAAVMREGLQSRFGHGGPGYSMPGHPYPGYRRYDLRSGASLGWITEGTVAHRGDGLHGLSGISIHTERRGEAITLDAVGEEAELWFLRQPGGGSFSLKFDGIDQGETSTAGEFGPASVKVHAGPGKHEMQVRTTSAQPVRILGTVIEQSSGVTWETLGINGAQIAMLGGLAEPILAPNVAARDPAMIVFAYGTNEANNPRWNASEYETSLRAVLARFRAMAPAATLLLAGPPDCRIRSTLALEQVIEIQRRVAVEAGAAYWDWRDRMGGAGSIRTWVAAGYAQGDHVHLTTAGYQLLGRTLFGDLMRLYEQFLQVRTEVAHDQAR
jgi:lysophospholipase L1-like esterase